MLASREVHERLLALAVVLIKNLNGRRIGVAHAILRSDDRSIPQDVPVFRFQADHVARVVVQEARIVGRVVHVEVAPVEETNIIHKDRTNPCIGKASVGLNWIGIRVGNLEA